MKFYLSLLAFLLAFQIGLSAQDTLQPQPVPVDTFVNEAPATTPTLIEVTVTKVYDGDGCRARFPDGSIQKLRFANVDAPEFKNAYVGIDSTQPHAYASRDSLRNLILGKKIYIDPKPFGKERYSYERLLVDVYLQPADTLQPIIYLNELVVSKGWAWSIPSRKGQERTDYSNYERIAEGQDYAKSYKLGVWKRKAVSPAYWRTNPYRKGKA